MRAGSAQFINLIEGYSVDCLRSLAISLHEELEELKLRQTANQRIYTEAHVQYCGLEVKYNTILKENEILKVQLAKEIDKNTLKAKSIFGRSTEKFLALVETADNITEEQEDESQVEASEDEDAKKSRIVDIADYKKNKDIDKSKNKDSDNPKNKGDENSEKNRQASNIRKKNRLATSMEKLPKQLMYDFDPKALDEEYGKHNWRIAFWHNHTTLEKMDTPYYTKTVYTPVISSGLEHALTTIPYNNFLTGTRYRNGTNFLLKTQVP